MLHKMLSILLVLLSTSEILSLTFNEEPADTAVLLDKTAQFNCSITCTASDICTGLTWSERGVSSPTGTDVDIYYETGDRFNPSHPNKDRYSIVPGTTSLLIHNVKKSDAGRYICRPNQGAVDATTKFAFLNTIEKSTCQSNGVAVAGGTASVVCNTQFNKSADAANTKTPALLWDIPTANQISAVGDSEITRTANFTVTKADNGRNYTCRTYYETPPPTFTDTCTTSIVVQFDPEIISITTDAEGGWSSIQPKDTVTCSASGNPGPSYRWRKVEGPGKAPAVINGPNITIVTAMEGNNTYTCEASNIVGGEPKTATRNVTFTVFVPTTTTTTTTVAPTTTAINTTPLDTSPGARTTGPGSGGSTEKEPPINTAAIAGGCAAGAVVIIIIIVVVIVMKRRKSKEAKDGLSADEEKQPGPPQTNPTMHPDVIRPANDNHHDNHDDPRNKNVENIQYADLALDDTPRSRKPIQLYDMALDTEYAEIQHGKRNY